MHNTSRSIRISYFTISICKQVVHLWLFVLLLFIWYMFWYITVVGVHWRVYGYVGVGMWQMKVSVILYTTAGNYIFFYQNWFSILLISHFMSFKSHVTWTFSSFPAHSSTNWLDKLVKLSVPNRPVDHKLSFLSAWGFFEIFCNSGPTPASPIGFPKKSSFSSFVSLLLLNACVMWHISAACRLQQAKCKTLSDGGGMPEKVDHEAL